MELTQRILRLYLGVSKYILRIFREQFAQKGLSLSHLLVLMALSDEGPMTIHQLAQQVGSAGSTISGVVDRLEKQGLARRSRSEFDRRMTYVEVTEDFHRIWNELDEGLDDWMEELNTLEPDAQRQVLWSLEQLEHAVHVKRGREAGQEQES